MKLNTTNLADVELGQPVFAEGTYHALIKNAEVKPNKQNTGNNLVLEYALTEPILLGKDGKEHQNKGKYALTLYVSLVPKDNYDPNQRLKELSLAIGNAESDDLELDQLKGKPVMVKLGIKAAEGQYREGNEIQRTTKRSADDMFQDPPL